MADKINGASKTNPQVVARLNKAFPKGTVIKGEGSHAMTVTGYSPCGRFLIGSYNKPNGKRVDETIDPATARTVIPGGLPV